MILTIEHGSTIRTKNSHLRIEYEGCTTLFPYKDITVLVIEGLSSSISIQCLLDCIAHGIYIVCCDKKFYPALHIVDLYSNYKLTERIHEQILWKQERKEECFRAIVVQKIRHQKELLEYADAQPHSIADMEALEHSCRTKEQTVHAIISTEGVAARIYFQALFSKSFRRFTEDATNCALNYGYALLRNLLTKYVVAKGLHPALGIHHCNMFNSYNLVDDCIEVFRPMVDYIVYTYCSTDATTLTKECKQKLLQIFLQYVVWDTKKHSIQYAIEKYIDSVIRYMNMDTNMLLLPHLDITLYEYK